MRKPFTINDLEVVQKPFDIIDLACLGTWRTNLFEINGLEGFPNLVPEVEGQTVDNLWTT